MSVFSTVEFSDTEFSALHNSYLWGLGALEELNRDTSDVWIHTAATNSI